MKPGKVILLVLLAVIMVINVVACGASSTEDTGNTAENTDSTSETPEVIDPLGSYEKPIELSWAVQTAAASILGRTIVGAA
jgi:putative aldouronate transport system substrate-binding protein